MKSGLVLEGGAFRGLFTSGVIDVMMEHDVWPQGIIGVSAGAAFGCNYKSRQRQRAIRYNKDYAKDSRYSGVRSLLTTGDYFNAQFAYHTMPRELDIFDNEAFERNPMEFYAVCTDVETGQPVYKLLDVGVADSIPLAYFESLGYQRNVVVLTQPLGYQKAHNKLMPLLRLSLRKYPRMIQALDERHLMYNHQLAYVAQAEAEGRCLVIRPDGPIPIGHVSHDPAKMQRVYDMGRAEGERRIADIIRFYNEP